mmetsp:Transcript_53729/g.173502  ORF Transcript_53729/g.173502 Transcript_53729/m.173502 type:complete len:235 (-) Transcript_53729:1955-2659(-)
MAPTEPNFHLMALTSSGRAPSSVICFTGAEFNSPEVLLLFSDDVFFLVLELLALLDFGVSFCSPTSEAPGMSLTRASKRTARAEDSVDDALFFDVLELAGSDLFALTTLSPFGLVTAGATSSPRGGGSCSAAPTGARSPPTSTGSRSSCFSAAVACVWLWGGRGGGGGGGGGGGASTTCSSSVSSSSGPLHASDCCALSVPCTEVFDASVSDCPCGALEPSGMLALPRPWSETQ